MTRIARFTRARTPATLAACLALLAACARHEPAAAPQPPASGAARTAAAVPAVPAAALPAPQALDKTHDDAIMRALFGAAYDAEHGRARTTMTVEAAQQEVLMTLIAAATLPDGRVGAVVNGMPDEDGVGYAGVVTSGILNVYVLQRTGNAWTVAARHEQVVELGSQGSIGGARWVMLGPGKPGFIVRTDGDVDGYSIADANIYELGKGLRSVGGFMQASNICAPDSDECRNVDSSIRFADEVQPDGYRDILVDFKGKRYTYSEGPDGKGVEHFKSAIRQTARYRFDGKAYVLKAGSEPTLPI
jgi:hypothetical protein